MGFKNGSLAFRLLSNWVAMASDNLRHVSPSGFRVNSLCVTRLIDCRSYTRRQSSRRARRHSGLWSLHAIGPRPPAPPNGRLPWPGSLSRLLIFENQSRLGPLVHCTASTTPESSPILQGLRNPLIASLHCQVRLASLPHRASCCVANNMVNQLPIFDSVTR
ncbi:hypothetical protein LY76DRAFT_157341 [Colletotrichum caudatum]|nr:hypothetical protein LY76DRAFT_157341 [Colletotrichum caudatum]